MDTYWLNKLVNVLRVQTNSENEKLMVLYLHKELTRLKLPYHIDAVGNVIVTKGKAKTYPCVVSHMDTVHDFVSNFDVYTDIDDNDILFALSNKKIRVGVGGDDKCGVFACLYLLKVIPDIKVVFFSREENGCKGSTGIDKTFFKDCRYLIQLDRRDNRDFIQTYWTNKTVSHDFSSEIGIVKKKYKYKNATGTVTDVMKLWNNSVGISCINLSCGYHQPHTAHEYVSISNLWHSVKFTEEIIYTMKAKKYVSLPPEPTVVKTLYAYKSVYDQCIICKEWKKDALLYPHNGEKICWPCKKKLYYKDKNSAPDKKAEHSKLQNGDIIVFACYECGVKPEEMKAGECLKYADGNNGTHLYCDSCASLLTQSLNSTKKESESEVGYICEMCNKVYQQTEPKTIVHTNNEVVIMCNDCATLWEETEPVPIKCFACNKIIPKDHKIIKRFGAQVCEDCALPSDTECKPKCKPN